MFLKSDIFKALVGHRGSTQFHLFELSRQLPRFAMLQFVKGKYEKPASFSTFIVKERIQRVRTINTSH